MKPTFLNSAGLFLSKNVKNLDHLLPLLAASPTAVSAVLVAPLAVASAFDTILPAGFPGSVGSWNLLVFSLYTGFGFSGAAAAPGFAPGFAPGLLDLSGRSGILGRPPDPLPGPSGFILFCCNICANRVFVCALLLIKPLNPEFNNSD